MTDQPTQRISTGHDTAAQTAQIPITQSVPPQQPPTVPPSVAPVQQNEPAPRKKRRGIVIAVIVVLALLAAIIGGVVYHTKHNEAYEACQSAVENFSTARKSVLDTSDNSGVLTDLVRNALGVDDILDAFADASSSAEQTVSSEGCSAHATIIQLNLVADTLNSATASLNESLKKMESEAQNKLKLNGGSSDSNDSDSDSDKSDNSDSSNNSDSQLDEELDQAKQSLQSSLDKAKELLGEAGQSIEDGTVGKALSNALNSAMDSAQELLESSGIADSKYFKAAQATIDEAVSAIQSWVDSQAAKVQ